MAVFVLSGCATSVMQGYVGQDVTQVMLERGPPVNVFELPDGRTAFQWQLTTGTVMPTTTTFTGASAGGFSTGQAFTTGGGLLSQTCTYTLYGQENPQGSYTVVGFEPPAFGCDLV